MLEDCTQACLLHFVPVPAAKEGMMLYALRMAAPMHCPLVHCSQAHQQAAPLAECTTLHGERQSLHAMGTRSNPRRPQHQGQ